METTDQSHFTDLLMHFTCKKRALMDAKLPLQCRLADCYATSASQGAQVLCSFIQQGYKVMFTFYQAAWMLLQAE